MQKQKHVPSDMSLEKMYIALDTTTGDGIISALQILRILKTTGKSLSELKSYLTKDPQRNGI